MDTQFKGWLSGTELSLISQKWQADPPRTWRILHRHCDSLNSEGPKAALARLKVKRLFQTCSTKLLRESDLSKNQTVRRQINVKTWTLESQQNEASRKRWH